MSTDTFNTNLADIMRVAIAVNCDDESLIERKLCITHAHYLRLLKGTRPWKLNSVLLVANLLGMDSGAIINAANDDGYDLEMRKALVKSSAITPILRKNETSLFQ
ncbi:MAG: hypothetical protein COA43_00625 [Robiginitomaculum sp.]|nr:MAG: hypothetical protein COA43_00625 [Robiginitomaculum sp.]